MIYEDLLKEERELKVLIAEIRAALEGAPLGNLRIIHGGNTPQYYYKTKENKNEFPQGRYLKKSEIEVARMIAQRDYDSKLLSIAEKQLKHLQELILHYRNNELQQVYEKLNRYRKEIVTPRVLPEEEYIKMWKKKEYSCKIIDESVAKIFTNQGEQVRSKSEKIIADMLEKQGINYYYEAPLILKKWGQVYPDFTILNVRKRKEIYWEHFGMMDDHEYCEKALKKIEQYQKSGYYPGDRLIITYETSRYPLETEMIERNIREYCM